ncbi:hypothetical protein LCGC14_1818790 [marine sediment metagenome]|uniref:Uncharacterized protein n=1 Tax=marine sediment metagenome TaxID=412755 RepID=A0A0F9GJM2_9ZZZZ
MIRKIRAQRQRYGRNNEKVSISGYLHFPKKYVGRYVSIELISDEKGKKFLKEIEKLEEDHKKEMQKREENLKEHLKKLKELRG